MARIAVAGPSQIVTDVAAAVAASGGSVVDVGIVAALTAMCTEPGVCGPGGGGFLTVDLPGEEPVVIDGYMAYPGKGYSGDPNLIEVTMPYGGGVTTLVGPGSIAVPGSFAALAEASNRFGRMGWAELLATVASAVESGFPLSAPCHTYLSEGATQVFEIDSMTRAALLEADGRPRRPGSPIVFEGLARTLRQIGAQGADTFYRGDLAGVIVDDLTARGGQLTSLDLDEYTVEVREPIEVAIEDWIVALNPPPAVGGVAVSQTVAAASDPTDLAVAKALVMVFEERRAGTRAPSTISVAAADEAGGAVAGSFSAGYVSGVVPTGTGLLMNNALGELELLGAEPIPGTRMISNMAPTVARRGEDVVALGSPGADRITTAVATTLLRMSAGDGLEAAVLHPRSHPEPTDGGTRLAIEPGAQIEGIGLEIRPYDELHMYFGGVNAAGLIDGDLVAYADPRRTGSVAYAEG